MALFDRLLRAAYRRLEPGARNALRTWLLLEQRDAMPEPITRYDGVRVLVIAPHADDEVIGCGGVMARHRDAGADVDVAFMTDGRWGDGCLHEPGITRAEVARRQTELVALRKDEARAAAARLGHPTLHFLDLPDARLSADDAAVSALSAVLAQVRPTLVYLPFVYDLHEDHWQTNRVFAAAAEAALAPGERAALTVRGYEVWSPLIANRVADITDVMPRKVEALRQFASQLVDQDNVHTVIGLNAYRSGGALGGRGHAEAFHELPYAGYARLVREAAIGHRRVQGAARPMQEATA